MLMKRALIFFHTSVFDMLLQSLGHFKGLLSPADGGVFLDDVVFRLHYAFTSYTLLFSSFLATGKVYLGSPIQVREKSIKLVINMPLISVR